MAAKPVFKEPRTSPPASGWKPGSRPPAEGYGQLDGNCVDNCPNVGKDKGRYDSC